MRKRITIPRVLIALALLSAVSREDTKPLVDLISFLAAIGLMVALVVSPFAATYAVWLYIRHRLGYPLPDRVAPLLGRLGRPRGALARVKVVWRAAGSAWREPASEAARGGEDTKEESDFESASSGTARV
jgi:hypothetical protein